MMNNIKIAKDQVFLSSYIGSLFNFSFFYDYSCFMLKISAIECLLISDEVIDPRLYNNNSIVCHITMHHFKS
jgi:hypothetical protein